MRGFTQKVVAICLSVVVTFVMSIGAASPAHAKTSRAAEVLDVVGEVSITKAGGSKSFRAYKDMTLNQGDHVQTGKGAKLVLMIADHDDEITIDQNTSLYISELTELAGGKKSKLKMWAGSLWNKVKTLVGTNDEFEVETPTAVMGVRGTQFFVTVDPGSGDSTFTLAAGVGVVRTPIGQGGENSIFVYPLEQLTIIFGDEGVDLGSGVGIIDLEEFVSNASSAIIEAIVMNLAAIAQENEAFYNRQKALIEQGQTNSEAEQLGISNQAELDRYKLNLDNLVGNIVVAATNSGVVNGAAIQQLVNQVNRQTGTNLNLGQVRPFELSDQQKKKQDEYRKVIEERNNRKEAERKAREEQAARNAEVLRKLEEQRAIQQLANQTANRNAREAADQNARRGMTAAERAAYEARQAELEKQKQAQNAAANQNANPGTGSTPGSGQPSPDPNAGIGKVTIGYGTVPYIWNEGGFYSLEFNLNIDLANFTGSNGIAGVQMEFGYNWDIEAWDYYSESDSYYQEYINGTIFSHDAPYEYQQIYGNDNDHTNKLNIAMINFPLRNVNILPSEGNKSLISLPFTASGYTVVAENQTEHEAILKHIAENIKITLKTFIITDKDGNVTKYTPGLNGKVYNLIIKEWPPHVT